MDGDTRDREREREEKEEEEREQRSVGCGTRKECAVDQRSSTRSRCISKISALRPLSVILATFFQRIRPISSLVC